MKQDRIQFANSLEISTEIAKEISIKHYFNELMAFYDLISLDQSEHEDGIKKFWFESDHEFAINIEFSEKINLQSFCDRLYDFNGKVYIYGLFYRLSFDPKEKSCTVRLSVLLDDEDPRVLK